MSEITSESGSRSRPLISRGVAMLLAVLLGTASVIGFAHPAQAVTTGITSNLLLNGETYHGTPVVNEGDVLSLRVQYDDSVQPGSTVIFDLGTGVTVTGVPSTNTAIAAVTQNGNQVAVTFKDPWPSDVNQGVFDLKVTVDAVAHSVEEPITWSIDGDQQSIDVIVRNQGDQFADVTDGAAKGVSPSNLDSYVTVVAGHVVLKPEITSTDLTYTLELDSAAARNGFPISDQLPAGLSYVAGSFAGQLTSWDADGLNRTTSAFPFAPTVTGTAFAGTVDVPGPSILKLTYTVRVTDPAALETLLQAQYDGLGGNPGNFQIQLQNTAMFGTVTKTASVRLQGTVAGVNIGQAFGKTSDWSSRNVTTDVDGNLTPPVALTYTLKADLRQWNGSNANFTLGRNVVISDPLPSQASWSTSAPDFITATGITLTQAATCPDATAFAADAFVGQYCVSGQTLLVNVGKDNTTNATIQAKATVVTVAGLSQGGSTTVQDAVPYLLHNAATFAYRVGTPYTATRDVTVVALPNTGDGLNDSSVFTKTGQAEHATVDPGQPATIDYTFAVSAGKGIDVRTSSIVDYLDASIFGSVDPSAVTATGTYDGQALTSADFELSTDADGNLVIALSTAGKAVVTAHGADKAFVVHVALTTLPFQGKETKTITNKATLFGQNGEPLYWSETSSEATSYGDEAEVRKLLYDRATGSWVDDVTAKMNGAGQLVQDTYVYRIQFIPHGSYSNVVIVPVSDALPASVQFLGFVTEANAPTAGNPSPGPVDIGGNLVATYDAAARTVTLEQKSGTVLQTGVPIAAYFAVKVTDASGPIVNSVGSSSTVIEPLPSVSVGDYVWVDSNRDGRQDAGEPGIPGVVLTVTGPDGNPVTDVDGNPVGPVTTDAHGKYTFDDLPALTGNQTYTVQIDRAASASALAPYVPALAGVGDRAGDSSTWAASSRQGDLHSDGDREPTLDFGFVTKSYAIGDYVWIDSNSDGVQDSGEKPLPGVGVSLLDGHGAVVATTTTDGNGRYVFDNLPAGTYQVRFTLTDDQKKQYRFTGLDAAANDAADSDAAPDTGLTRLIVLDDTDPALTTSYGYRTIAATQGVDPTWDAGVILKTYAIGDYVWIDSNGNGIQDSGEKALPGVKVALLDEHGETVATTTTDRNGHYAFDNLPAGTYQVRFTLTDKQKALYRFTARDARSDDSADSDAAGTTGLTRQIVLDDTNPALTTSYGYRTIAATQGIDPTWDAGVELAPASSAVGNPSGSTGVLAHTGLNIGIWVLAGGLALFAGAIMIVTARRKHGRG